MYPHPRELILLPTAPQREETRQFNAALVGMIVDLPDQWSVPPAVVRERRAQGIGPFPAPVFDPNAERHAIAGPHGEIPLRVVRPRTRPARGAFLHIHGGGWVLGSAFHQDQRLAQLAERTGLIAVSVDYRLAPEHPYPHGPDDCEAAALWLTHEGAQNLGVEWFAIGGDSAGAHLSAVTLLRLRDRHAMTPFSAAVFIAGCFDLRLTPSVRRWGDEKLIVNTRDITLYAEHFLASPHDRESPDISPLMGDLQDLPPAHFCVGTRDPLLDDTLFMAGRWAARGAPAELAVFPEACHVFQIFPLAVAEESNALIDAFLAREADRTG